MSGIPGLQSASGIDTETVINSILTQRARRIGIIEDRIAKAEDEKRALLDINARLLSMQETSRRLYTGSSFNASIINSSNESALLATGDSSSIEGTFNFQTYSLASVSQYVSSGFSSTGNASVTTQDGILTIETGNARVHRPSTVDLLNGGEGIDRGKIRISDDKGNVALVDLGKVVNIDDIVNAINNNGTVQVNARVNDMIGSGYSGQSLIVENTSGTGNIKIENLGNGSTATSLGIEGESAFGVIVGEQINTIGRNTKLSDINDTRGFGDGSNSSKILTITDSVGATDVDLADVETIGDVLDAINTSGANVVASIAADGRSLQIVDNNPPFAIAFSGSTAVINSLGLTSGPAIEDAASGTYIGRPLIASLNSVLMDSLGGVDGNGFYAGVATPSSFDVTDSNGITTTVNYTGREDLFELVNQINNPMLPGANVLARLDDSGTGFEIVDLANGPLDLTITDVSGTIATEMGIEGTHSDGLADAGNLNFKFLHGNRLLSDFGLDEGFVDGQIDITQKNGSISTIDITAVQTVGQLIDTMNQLPTISFALNTRGDGFRINDTSGGTGTLTIKDRSGTIASKLGLRGTFTGPSLFEQRMEYEIDVTTQDTLNDVADRIRGLDIPVVVTTFDDGTGQNSHRLSITSRDSGTDNDIIVRSDMSKFGFGQTSVASDAIMLYGSAVGSADPVVLRSNDSSFKNVLPGVTLDLLTLTDNPITVSITRDLQAAANDITELFEGYNSLASRLDELASFNTETFEAGPLLGNSTIKGLENTIVAALLNPVEGLSLGSNTAASFGIDIETDGSFTVNSDDLLEALENRLDDLTELFSHSARLDPETNLESWNKGAGLKAVDGTDFTISFMDGSADMQVDLDQFDELRQLIDFMNADGRMEASISGDGKRLVFRDLTTGTNSFTFADVNDSGAISSLGLSRSTALPDSNKIETKNISLGTELGIARQVDKIVTSYTTTGGLIEDETEAIDERITEFNDDIEVINERIEAERERLERQFQAMEAALAESQQAADMLQQFSEQQKKNNDK